jgi:putative transposase
MRVVGLPKVVYQLARRRPVELSVKAHDRLRWVLAWQALREHGLSSGAAGERLGLARPTLYRWLGRLQQQGARGLEPRSRKPHRRRQPTWSVELVEAVQALREQYPRWGKDKLVVLLRREGRVTSPSMVGRILRRLKARGLLREPPRGRISARQRLLRRPYAVRKPKDYQPQRPGELVQLDTLDVRPLPGLVLKQFTARDMVSRWDVLEVHSRATATTATRFLRALQARSPFPVKAVQVDGGSEFMAGFEDACRQEGIHLFVLPPRSPKLNGRVERANRTHTEEFYELYDGDLDLPSLNSALRQWEHIYNTVRPHQALDFCTPAEYLRECHPELAASPLLSHM